MGNTKKIFVFDDDSGQKVRLLLNQDQVAVFRWLIRQGYPMKLEPYDDEPPYEIRPEDLCNESDKDKPVLRSM